MSIRMFNKMIKEIGLVKEDGSIDYEWIAIKLWLQMSTDKKNPLIEARLDIINAYIEKCRRKG